MNNLLLYFLKVSFGVILFYISYHLFFSRDTFYLRNRFYLLGTLVLSILIPLFKFYKASSGIVPFEHSIVLSAINTSGNTLEEAVKLNSFDFISLITWIYFSVSTILLLKLLISVIRTLKIIRKGTLLKTSFPKVVLSKVDHPPFSFFPYVVIPVKTFESAEYPSVLSHENAHITQGHTFDLLLIEFIITFLWFNPFIWLIRRSIVLNHEYLADNISIRSQNIKEYQYKLLNLHKSLMHVPLAHNFSSLIKNRIIMINKKPTRNYAALKSIIILPVIAILFVMFSFKPESNQIKTGNQKPLFSSTSESEILKFLAMNTGYPQEAKNSLDTGSVFVVVKMQKGGIVKECTANTAKKGINVPFLKEIVIVGYKPSAGKTTEKNIATGKDHEALKTESLRIANRLNEVKVPEWNERDMEFAIPIKFILK